MKGKNCITGKSVIWVVMLWDRIGLEMMPDSRVRYYWRFLELYHEQRIFGLFSACFTLISISSDPKIFKPCTYSNSKEGNEEENLAYKDLDILLHRVIREEILIFRKWQYLSLWEKIHKNISLIPNYHRDTVVRTYTHKGLWMVIMKYRLASVKNYFNFYLKINDVFVTVQNTCLKIPRSPSTRLATRVQNCVLFVWVDLHVSLCGQQRT